MDTPNWGVAAEPDFVEEEVAAAMDTDEMVGTVDLVAEVPATNMVLEDTVEGLATNTARRDIVGGVAEKSRNLGRASAAHCRKNGNLCNTLMHPISPQYLNLSRFLRC